jgi:hypothetical protein
VCRFGRMALALVKPVPTPFCRSDTIKLNKILMKDPILNRHLNYAIIELYYTSIIPLTIT